MVRQAMGARWTAYQIQLSCFAILIFVLECHGCSSLNSEGFALFQFRAKVNFDPSGALSNWDPNDCDPCRWSGVECLDGKVIMLNLNGYDLEGVLVPELGNLTHLRYLDLSKNRLSGKIPPQFGQLTILEVLDLRDNKLSGTLPAELGGLHSLKHLLLCNNKFEGSIPVEIEKLSLLTDLQFDDFLTTAAAGFDCVNRKFGHCIWQTVKKSDSFWLPIKWSMTSFLNLFLQFKFGSESSRAYADDSCSPTNLAEPGVAQNVKNPVSTVRRILAEMPNNLVAIPPKGGAPPPPNTGVSIPSRSSGAFPAVPKGKQLSPAPSHTPPPTTTNAAAIGQEHAKKSSGGGNALKSILGTTIPLFLIIIAAVIFFISRSKAAKTIGPWKTGLSGQLQKAFVTGVPKLNRSELETACEDFSNIIIVKDGVATLYKGTLSSGVEIAVVSSAITSRDEWSNSAELAFRKKIDSLSRVNHKNFVNLIGYCEEDEPFTRMMVFEYAPNGTLFEHLQVKDLEHLDWHARMRIIMGTAYCLQHIHDLTPPVVHANLTCNEIFLTDDYAAKIADVAFWAELVSKSKNRSENGSEDSELPPLADVETNIHSFGILLLEIISGKLYSEEKGNLVNWATPYLNDKSAMSKLVDLTLKAFKDNELDVVCEVILNCIEQDPRKRPTMKEVVEKLGQAIEISPEAATPRLSPLWWAELEILSAEAP